MKAKTTTKYGTVDLPILNSKDALVPKSATPIKMSKEIATTLGLSVLLDKPALLVGETGTGKTSMIRELAYRTKHPYVRVNMTGFTTPDELIGSKSVKNGATYFENGIVTDAMQRGAILVLDEINATTPDCMFILHGLLDDDKRITLPNGDVVVPHDNFRVFATCNPDYEGTKSLNKALLDRFKLIIGVDVLSASQERDLVVKRTNISLDVATTLVTIANTLRKEYTESKITTYTSTRTILNIAELISTGMKIEDAFAVGLTNKAQAKEEQRALNDVFCSVLKIPVDTLSDDFPISISQGELKRIKANSEQIQVDIAELRQKQKQLDSDKMDLIGEKNNLMSERASNKILIEEQNAKIAELTEKLSHYRWIEEKLTKGVTI